MRLLSTLSSLFKRTEIQLGKASMQGKAPEHPFGEQFRRDPKQSPLGIFDNCTVSYTQTIHPRRSERARESQYEPTRSKTFLKSTRVTQSSPRSFRITDQIRTLRIKPEDIRATIYQNEPPVVSETQQYLEQLHFNFCQLTGIILTDVIRLQQEASQRRCPKPEFFNNLELLFSFVENIDHFQNLNKGEQDITIRRFILEDTRVNLLSMYNRDKSEDKVEFRRFLGAISQFPYEDAETQLIENLLRHIDNLCKQRNHAKGEDYILLTNILEGENGLLRRLHKLCVHDHSENSENLENFHKFREYIMHGTRRVKYLIHNLRPIRALRFMQEAILSFGIDFEESLSDLQKLNREDRNRRHHRLSRFLQLDLEDIHKNGTQLSRYVSNQMVSYHQRFLAAYCPSIFETLNVAIRNPDTENIDLLITAKQYIRHCHEQGIIGLHKFDPESDDDAAQFLVMALTFLKEEERKEILAKRNATNFCMKIALATEAIRYFQEENAFSKSGGDIRCVIAREVIDNISSSLSNNLQGLAPIRQKTPLRSQSFAGKPANHYPSSPRRNSDILPRRNPNT